MVDVKEESICSGCGNSVSFKVADYSLRSYNKTLCMDCQKKQSTPVKDGLDYTNFAELLESAHKKGLKNIHTVMLSEATDDVQLFKAIVTTLDFDGKDCTFVGHGDASKENVGKNIAPHIIRMAETRAIVRALRFATNIAKTSKEEL